MKKILIYSLAALTFVACGKKENTEEKEERVEQVRTTVLKAQEIERVISVSTNLQGYVTLNVAPSLTGTIEHIFVEVGNKVSKGQALVNMDQTQYKTTKINLANLETEKKRVEMLLKTGSATQQQLDQLTTQYNATKEQLEFIEANTYYKAPFSGVIANYFPKLKEGMKLTLTSEIYPDKIFPATVEIVYPTIDPSSHTFQCKIVIPNGSQLLRPGMYVTTQIGLGKEKAIVAPYQAVEKLVGANDRYVFLNENGYAKRVAVTLGQRFDQNIEIIAPEITDGVELVTTGQHKLVDGVKINVVE